MNRFPINSKVVDKTNLRAGYSYHASTVIAHTEDGGLVTELFGSCEKFTCGELDSLLTESQALDEQQRLDLEQESLEKQFEKVKNQIQSKMDQATVLVREATDIAKSVKKDFRSLRNECRPLFRALNEAGWSASSMNC